MVNASDDIRQLMDRLNGLRENEESQVVEEGIFDSIKGMMDRRAGRKERQEMLSKLSKEWNHFLGKSDRIGTVDDMAFFLEKRVKLDKSDITYVIDMDEFTDAYGDGGEEETSSDPEEDSVDQADDNGEEPDAESVDSDNEPTDPSEDGIEMPDLDAKLSDYGPVGDDAKEVHGDPATFKKANGEWDEDRIVKQLKRIGDDKVLVLGDEHFSLSPDDKNEVEKEKEPANESILNEWDLNRLSKAHVRRIFNNVVNLYLDQLPADGEEGYEFQDQKQSSNKDKGPGDNYDLDRMWEILKQGGMSSQVVKRVMSKVGSSTSVANMSDTEMKHLSMIGYAFLKSGM